jgi:hypothetical protein
MEDGEGGIGEGRREREGITGRGSGREREREEGRGGTLRGGERSLTMYISHTSHMYI